MSAQKAPLARVKEKFESKEKLVDALLGLPAKVLERDEDDKDAYRKKLLSAANSKLLRLYQIGQEVQTRWGSKDQLVEAILTLQNKAKDKDYRTRLAAYPIGRLFDRHGSLERAQKKAQAEKSA